MSIEWLLTKALWTSDEFGLARFDSVQPRYNLLFRHIEVELLPMAKDQGVGVIIYNPPAVCAPSDCPRVPDPVELIRARAVYAARSVPPRWSTTCSGTRQPTRGAPASSAPRR